MTKTEAAAKRDNMRTISLRMKEIAATEKFPAGMRYEAAVVADHAAELAVEYESLRLVSI